MLQISLAVEVEVLRFMTSYSVNGRTPTFRSTLSSQTFAADILRLVSAMSSNGTTSFEIFTAVVIQVLIFWVMTPWSFPCRWRQNGPPKLWYPTTKPRVVTNQRILTRIFTAAKTRRSHNEIYEDVSKSFRTESITKYTLTTITIQKQHKCLWWQNSLDWLTK